jgi:hypothetical protein
MKRILKILGVVVALVVLAIITEPWWRYKVFSADGFYRYDRITGEVQEWNPQHGGQWEKYQREAIPAFSR